MSQSSRAFLALSGKELKEGVRSYRFWVLLGVLVIFGLISPISAKLLPEILGSALPSGMSIDIPTPTFADAYLQYFKNLAQVGVLVVILVSMGAIADEKSKGTAVLVLVRPVSRAGFVVAKSLILWLMMIVTVAIASGGALAYTYGLFTGGEATGFLVATLGWMSLLAALMSVTVLFSVIFSSPVLAGVSSFGVYIVLSVLPVFGWGLDEFTPGAVPVVASAVATGTIGSEAMIWPVASSLLLAAVAIVAAAKIFKHQEI